IFNTRASPTSAPWQGFGSLLAPRDRDDRPPDSGAPASIEHEPARDRDDRTRDHEQPCPKLGPAGRRGPNPLALIDDVAYCTRGQAENFINDFKNAQQAEPVRAGGLISRVVNDPG
ncbi:MAG: hypothetical protein KF773_40505, partial [Deltaproteobacteria bacterium]|nr:hypothetical protein [Deltaproteobacteria bacterium]